MENRDFVFKGMCANGFVMIFVIIVIFLAGLVLLVGETMPVVGGILWLASFIMMWPAL